MYLCLTVSVVVAVVGFLCYWDGWRKRGAAVCAYVTCIHAAYSTIPSPLIPLTSSMNHQAMGDNESSVAEMSNRLTEQEAFISELEKELSTLQAEFETERANQSQQVCRLDVRLVVACATDLVAHFVVGQSVQQS